MTQKTTPFNKTHILSPEQIDVDKEYTFTVSPNDDYQFWNDKQSERLKKATNHMTYIARQYMNLDLCLYVDVSRNGRIHWHGTIRFKTRLSIKEFYTEIIHELLTKHQIEMDTIKDLEIWLSYCTKVKHLWDEKVFTNTLIKMKDRFVNVAKHQREIGEY